MRVLIKTVAGSHLFGTNTETSDMDYKGVYLPTAEQVLLGNYEDTKRSSTGDGINKNSKEDVDVELYSLRKFFKMISNGDTAALELLFTPDEFIVEKDPVWDYIVSQRDRLLSRKVTAMIGYARQQANKYGIKGSRMGALSTTIEKLKEVQKTFDFERPKLKHGWDKIQEALKDVEHIEFITLNTTKKFESEATPAIDILGKKFDYHNTFIHVLEILKKIYKNYGHRAREAKKNNGVDWKALSHATRVSLQGLEMLQEGTITLPHKDENLQLLMDIKLGKMDYKDVGKLLEELLVKLEAVRDNSDLPDKVDKTFVNSIIKKVHLNIIQEQYGLQTKF